MSAVPSPSLIRQAYESYIAAGFALVPIHQGKGPSTEGWNEAANVWARPEQIIETVGVGLAHAFSTPTTMALDIDNIHIFKELATVRGIDVDELFAAPDSVMIDSGNPGHSKLIYTIPFAMQSKRIMQGGKVIAELRCATAEGLTVQDVLPSLAIHPKTNQHYRWAGNGHFTKLPPIPMSVLVWWSEIVAADAGAAATPRSSTAPLFSHDEITAAVNFIDPSCDRRTWIDVGMALATLGDELFPVWDTWSQLSPEKYPGEPEMRKQWASFKNDKGVIVTVGTLIHHAQAAGWVRPAPDVSKMFAPVQKAEKIKDVVDELDLRTNCPNIDLSRWPNALVRRALEVSDEVGCDPVVPLMAGITAISAAVDKRTTLNINPTWQVPPNIWIMTIGEPSDKKTPGSKPMFGPLTKLEQADRDRYEVELLLWQGKEAKHAAEMKAYREWEASPESSFPGAVPPKVSTLPPQPQPLRLIVTDATTQKIISMAEGRPRGFLLYLDEMNRWLTKLADPRTTDDRSCWVKGYETGPAKMDRVGSGTTEVEHFALSVYGNCQPTVFMENVVPASSDGIMQRFLPVPLDATKNKVWSKAVPEFMSSAYDYEQLINRTFALPKMTYEFSPEAHTLFQGFSRWVIETQRNEKILATSTPYQTALGKLDGQTARLILLFHIINDPYSTVIPMETVATAVAIMKEYLYPALRYTFLEVGQQQDPMAKAVMNLLVQWSGAKDTVTLADLRAVKYRDNSGRAPWQSDQLLRVIMDDLSAKGYVAMHTDHPRFPVWIINPELGKMFAQERRGLIEAKVKVRESIGRQMSKLYGREIVLGGRTVGQEELDHPTQ